MGITAATLRVAGDDLHRHHRGIHGVWQALMSNDAIISGGRRGDGVRVGRPLFRVGQSGRGATGAGRLERQNVAILLADGTEMVPSAGNSKRTALLVRPGRTIAADGLVVEGKRRGRLMRCAMTGESKACAGFCGRQRHQRDRRARRPSHRGGRRRRHGHHFAGMVRLVDRPGAKADARSDLPTIVAGVFVHGVP